MTSFAVVRAEHVETARNSQQELTFTIKGVGFAPWVWVAR